MLRSKDGTPSLNAWGALIAGIFVAFPSLMPGVADGSVPRTTDLLTLFCVGLLGWAVLTSAKLNAAINKAVLIWVLTVPWIFMEIYALSGAPDPPVQRLLIRWILSGFTAYVITVVTENPGLRARFMYGLLIGVVCSSVTLAYDFFTFSPEDMPIDQLVTLAIYDGKNIHDFVYRAAGIFGHPNGAAGCVLIGVPILIGVIQEGRLPRWTMVFAFLLMGVVFYLTKSRGPLAMSGALVGYWIWYQAAGYRLHIVLAGIVVGLGLLATGGLGMTWGDRVLMERFFDFEGIFVNASDRWWTIATSLELMVQNPLGMGSAYVEPLEIATGTSATHNAYLELALMGGIPLMVVVIFPLVRAAARLVDPWQPVEAWLAAYLLGIFAFESYFLQVNIQVLTFWLAICPLRSLRRQVVPRTELLARPLPRRELTAASASRSPMR